MLREARTEFKRTLEVKMKEGESKGKGAFGRCVIWGGGRKNRNKGDNVEGKESTNILYIKFLFRI